MTFIMISHIRKKYTSVGMDVRTDLRPERDRAVLLSVRITDNRGVSDCVGHRPSRIGRIRCTLLTDIVLCGDTYRFNPVAFLVFVF